MLELILQIVALFVGIETVVTDILYPQGELYYLNNHLCSSLFASF